MALHQECPLLPVMCYGTPGITVRVRGLTLDAKSAIDLAAKKQNYLQVLLYLCGMNSCQKRYDLQASKSSILDCNKPNIEITTWSIRQ